jgi:hypothetical protein
MMTGQVTSKRRAGPGLLTSVGALAVRLLITLCTDVTIIASPSEEKQKSPYFSLMLE